jgi:hypothetical protein
MLAIFGLISFLLIVFMIYKSINSTDYKRTQMEIAAKMVGEDVKDSEDDFVVLKIAGISHRQNIKSYVGNLDCALVPEPSNEYDPNAIKIIAEDGHHLGYVAEYQTDMVRDIAGGNFPFRCRGEIGRAVDEEDGHTYYYGKVFIKKKEG